MKKAIYLLLTLFLISCSKDDNGGSNEPKTFLEKFDGTGFYYRDSYNDFNDYVFFEDSTYFFKQVIEESDFNDCFQVKEGSNLIDGDTFNVSIVTNDLESLFIEVNADGERFSLEFTVNGNNLNGKQIYGDGSFDSFSYVKTNTTFNSLCN